MNEGFFSRLLGSIGDYRTVLAGRLDGPALLTHNYYLEQHHGDSGGPRRI